MTYNFCKSGGTALGAATVEHEIWQVRARRAGLSQRLLALLAGKTENTVSRQLRGLFDKGQIPIYLKTIIRSWEMLSEEQREALRTATENNDDGI